MPDIRALLDDATAGATPHPDPVTAVHTRVRRRVARRRTAVAAGAGVAAVAGGAAVLSRPAPTARVTPAASASAASDRSWRAPLATVVDRHYATAYDRLAALVTAHPDVFLTATVQGTDTGLGWLVAVSVGADADPADWQARVAEAAGAMPWRFVRCGATTARYDAVAAEVRSAAWPSGATVRGRVVPHAVTYGDGCAVQVTLVGTALDPRDAAYARTRWGTDVRLDVKPAP